MDQHFSLKLSILQTSILCIYRKWKSYYLKFYFLSCACLSISYISHFPSLCALHRHIIVIPQGISIICKLTCCLPFLISTRSAHRCITFIMYLIFSPSYLHICIQSRPVCGIPTQSLSYLRYIGLSLGGGVCIGSPPGSSAITFLFLPLVCHVLKRFFLSLL